MRHWWGLDSFHRFQSSQKPRGGELLVWDHSRKWRYIFSFGWTLGPWVFVFRLRHVHIYQTVRTVPERESLRLPSDGFWLHQSEEGVRIFARVLARLCHPAAVWRTAVLRSCSAEGVMRTMTTEKLLKGMPVLQTQIDTLLEFDVSETMASVWGSVTVSRQLYRSLPRSLSGSSQGAEQRHHQRRIPAALQGPGQTVCLLQRRHHQPFRSVVVCLRSKDISIFRRWACNSRAEKYFKMKKSDCKEALEIYKRFLTRVTKIGEFMKLAEVRDNLCVTSVCKWCHESGFRGHSPLFF